MIRGGARGRVCGGGHMLLRAALLYCLAVFSFIFAAATIWGRFELSAVREASAELAGHVQQLEKDLDAERLKVEAAERRAMVAEDSLQRANDKQTKYESDANETRMKFAAELSAALRDRDDAKAEVTKLSSELENARGLLRVAEKAAAAARADAEQARVKAEAAAVAATAVKPAAKSASKPADGKAAVPKSPSGTAQETPKAPAAAPAAGNAGKTSSASSAASLETSSVAKAAAAKPAAAAAEKAKVVKPAKAASAQGEESSTGKSERRPAVRPASRPEPDNKGFIQF